VSGPSSISPRCSFSQNVSASTQEQARSSDQVMGEISKANKFAEEITSMTTQQRERSQNLQQIMQEMSNVALKNASGAENSHQFSQKLVEVMGEFSALIGQFKIGEHGSNGGGARRAEVKEQANPERSHPNLHPRPRLYELRSGCDYCHVERSETS